VSPVIRVRHGVRLLIHGVNRQTLRVPILVALKRLVNGQRISLGMHGKNTPKFKNTWISFKITEVIYVNLLINAKITRIRGSAN